MKHLGYCKYCKTIVHKKRKRNIFGQLVPCWVIVEGSIFHDNCWKEYNKVLIRKKKIGFETPMTPLGKVKFEEEYH